MAGVFSGCQIVLDLTTSVRFKEKAQLRKSITDNGGVVSYIVTKKVTLKCCTVSYYKVISLSRVT